MLRFFKSVSLVLLAAACCSLGNVYAADKTASKDVAIAQQKQTVKGNVKDAFGPVAGASVFVKGTSNGTITNLDGDFSLDVNNGDVITVSFIGFISQEIKFTGQSNLKITLVEDSQALGEVVVTALGMNRQKKGLGYAMTEIKGDDIAKVNVVNPINGLQGKVAGVQINMGSSGPQSSNRIIIRGNTSLQKNNQPIFVIDGTILSNDITESAQWGAQQDFGNGIKNLNSDDFESVSVLKGAAATALYGSRAANGVVMITTKKGKRSEGVGVSVTHSMMWDKVYGFPDLQNEFGPGTTTVWPLNPDGTENRTTSELMNFGPAFDGKPYKQGSLDWMYAAQKNNVDQLYQTGQYMNTNVAIQGGDEKGSFRFSYSHLESNGTTLNNDYGRNSFSLNANRDISKFLNAEAIVSWVRSDTKNPTKQGGGGSPIYDFVYGMPRTYDTTYWLDNYMNEKGDGWNGKDPTGYSGKLWDQFVNNKEQQEDNFRGNLNLKFTITDWLNVKLMGDYNKLYSIREDKIVATGQADYSGAEYRINKNDVDEYKLTAMVNATRQFGDFGVNGSVAIEQWNKSRNYYRTYSQGGLRIPYKWDMTNSVKQVTNEVRLNTDRKRINSVYAYVNLDWKSQLFLDITGRNDWSSSLIYKDGSGTMSYFYPSVSSSWIITETFRDQMPDFLSFAKVRGSFAIVGNDCDPYLTSIGYYKINDGQNTYVSPLNGTEYPLYVFDSNDLRNLHLKPERQTAIEFGAELKFFQNRFGVDFTWYKNNTRNQIVALAQARETGMNRRWINAGDIQNSGIEIVLNAKPIQTKDWNWDITLNMTHNQNKIVALTEGLDKYEIEGGVMDLTAYATVGGSYGDIYTPYTYMRNDKGEKLLNANGSWIRSGVSEKVGEIQPNLLGGLSSNLSYKNVSLGVVLDARWGGNIASGTYNYGRYTGTIGSSLVGRTQEYGGLERTLSDGRKVYDGMIPEGVFNDGTKIGGQDVSGMSYQQAYEQGLVKPLSAYEYYSNMHSWGTGIREEAVLECSWVSLREVSLNYVLPTEWTRKAYIQQMRLGLVANNLCYLYNSLPDNIHPEGLASNRSYEFGEIGGGAYTRRFGFTVNVTF